MLEFQLRKHKKSGIEITWRDLIMEAEVFDRSAELSIVTGSNLDPKKSWYVLTKSKCEIRPKAFAKNELFRRFRDDYNTFCPASRSQARQQRLFVQRQVTKQHTCYIFKWSLCRTN